MSIVLEPKERWYKTDIKEISRLVLLECQKLNPEIKFEENKYSVLSFSIYMEAKGKTNNEERVIKESTDFNAFDPYYGGAWSRDTDESKYFCKGLRIDQGLGTSNSRVTSKYPERLLKMIPEITKNLEFRFTHKLTNLINNCNCSVRVQNKYKHNRNGWEKLLQDLNVPPETEGDTDFMGKPYIQTGNGEITLDKEKHSTLRFSSNKEINFQDFNVNITNITKEQLIKLLEVLKN